MRNYENEEFFGISFKSLTLNPSPSLTPALSKGEGARKGREFKSLIFKIPLFWRGI